MRWLVKSLRETESIQMLSYHLTFAYKGSSYSRSFHSSHVCFGHKMFFYYIVHDYLTAYERWERYIVVISSFICIRSSRNNTINPIIYTSLFLFISYAITDAYDMYWFSLNLLHFTLIADIKFHGIPCNCWNRLLATRRYLIFHFCCDLAQLTFSINPISSL